MMSSRGKNLRPLGAFGLLGFFGEEVYVFVMWFGLDWLEVVLSTWPPGGGFNFLQRFFTWQLLFKDFHGHLGLADRCR